MHVLCLAPAFLRLGPACLHTATWSSSPGVWLATAYDGSGRCLVCIEAKEGLSCGAPSIRDLRSSTGRDSCLWWHEGCHQDQRTEGKTQEGSLHNTGPSKEPALDWGRAPRGRAGLLPSDHCLRQLLPPPTPAACHTSYPPI